MKPHIEQTISDLNNEIAQLEDIISFLRKREAGQPMAVRQPEASSPISQPERTGDHPGTGFRAATEPEQDIVLKKKRHGQRTLDAARRLTQPFGADDLVQAAGITLCNANGYIHRWKIKGWIAPDAPGQYRRTPDFGGVTTRNTTLLEEIHAEIEAKKAQEAGADRG